MLRTLSSGTPGVGEENPPPYSSMPGYSALMNRLAAGPSSEVLMLAWFRVAPGENVEFADVDEMVARLYESGLPSTSCKSRPSAYELRLMSPMNASMSPSDADLAIAGPSMSGPFEFVNAANLEGLWSVYFLKLAEDAVAPEADAGEPVRYPDPGHNGCPITLELIPSVPEQEPSPGTVFTACPSEGELDTHVESPTNPDVDTAAALAAGEYTFIVDSPVRDGFKYRWRVKNGEAIIREEVAAGPSGARFTYVHQDDTNVSVSLEAPYDHPRCDALFTSWSITSLQKGPPPGDPPECTDCEDPPEEEGFGWCGLVGALARALLFATIVTIYLSMCGRIGGFVPIAVGLAGLGVSIGWLLGCARRDPLGCDKVRQLMDWLETATASQFIIGLVITALESGGACLGIGALVNSGYTGTAAAIVWFVYTRVMRCDARGMTPPDNTDRIRPPD